MSTLRVLLARIGLAGVLVVVGVAALGILVTVALMIGFSWSGSELNRERDAGPPIVAPGGALQVFLSRFSSVTGTTGLRAWLYRRGSEGGFGSSDYSGEIRNLLTLRAGEPEAQWLLPDHQHIIEDSTDLTESGKEADPVVATVALIKPVVDDLDMAGGRLLLLDPLATRVVEVATSVRRLHLSSVAGGQISLLYERERKLVRATFDSATLAPLGEIVVEVPQLNS